MSLVSTEDRGSLRVITYANAPFGTLTGCVYRKPYPG
jgi:hypothetical protein